MPDFRNIATNVAHVERAGADGDVLWIDYRPGNITPRQVHQANRWAAKRPQDLTSDEQEEARDNSMHLLAALVIRWNVTNQGVPVAPTLDGLEDVTYAAQRALINIIMEDMRGDPKQPALPEPAVSEPAVKAVERTLAATAETERASIAALSTDASLAVPPAPSSPPSLNGTAFTPSPSGSISASLTSLTPRNGGLTGPSSACVPMPPSPASSK